MIGVGDDCDTVCERDAYDDHRQAIFALQPSPGLRSGHDEIEDHEPGGLMRQGAFRSHGSMPDGGEDALSRVCGAGGPNVRRVTSKISIPAC